MSILIRGMEMPESCFECPFECDYAFICSLTNKETRKQRKEHAVNEYEAMPEWCPLVEVPTPHGRLIDADKLSVSVLDGMYSNDEYEDVIWELVQDATTIIEAEGEKEDV